ncbi:SDR family oxidoreductase [uncultured Tateyamaria sp.]|uniref:SDR family NAD(P)-dependent oxidoreductase n=1 Tax=uncultured Tateyamaria sp. TaxID=455651 RepID=UPI002614A4E7|nr:SDR family oxidoreductase [uncultured Tateyamaria sp.]
MNGKRALVTGSLGGIGSLVVERLAKRGYRLVLVDLDATQLEQQASAYSGAEPVVLDHTDLDAVERFCSDMIADGPPFDLAFVNAGIIVIGDYTDLSWAQVDQQMRINLTSPARLLHALAIAMKARGSGHLIATVSQGGIIAMKGSATYSATKFGLRGLMLSLQDELAPFGVHVSSLLPAGVDTPMLRHEALQGGSALNFVGTPVAASIVANAFEHVLDRPRGETYIPWSESVSARLGGAFPWLVTRLTPVLERMGERGRRKFIRRTGIQSSEKGRAP